MNRVALLTLLSAILVVVAIVACALPWREPVRTQRSFWHRIGDPLATGIFLGAGLIHMLPDSAEKFADLHTGFPWAFVICGATAIVLAGLDRAGPQAEGATLPPIIATIALMVHSFLAGAALGAAPNQAAIAILFVALIAHKGAASFSLSRVVQQSSLPRSTGFVMLGLFIVALPIGVAMGQYAVERRLAWPYAVPMILAFGAGTFLHFGTLHRHRIEVTDSVAKWWAPLFGFLVMAAVALIA